MNRLLAIVVIATLPLVACGDPLTKAEAKRAWPTTGGTLHNGEANNNALQSEIGVGFAAPCPEGGDMEFSVSLGDILNAAAGSFGFDVAFDDCKNNGLTMNGDVEYSLTIQTDATNTSLAWNWKGDLDYDGTLNPCPETETECTVEGDCDFDMTGSISVTGGASDTDPTTVEVAYEGDLCGYEAGTWLNVTTTP